MNCCTGLVLVTPAIPWRGCGENCWEKRVCQAIAKPVSACPMSSWVCGSDREDRSARSESHNGTAALCCGWCQLPVFTRRRRLISACPLHLVWRKPQLWLAWKLPHCRHQATTPIQNWILESWKNSRPHAAGVISAYQCAALSGSTNHILCWWSWTANYAVWLCLSFHEWMSSPRDINILITYFGPKVNRRESFFSGLWRQVTLTVQAL